MEKTGYVIRVPRDGKYENIDIADALADEFANYIHGLPEGHAESWACHLHQWIKRSGDFDRQPVGLMRIIREYYEFRGLLMPSEYQAFMFLTSEVGELADALVSSAGNWVRNHPDRERNSADEAADVLMMLYVTMMSRGIDPLQALLDKMAKKGFRREEA